jgi:peptide deformylase
MAVFKVLKYPHVLLRKKSSRIDNITPDLTEFAQNMIETMNAYDGIGLAAPQVGILKRFIVMDIKTYLENKEMKDWHGNIQFELDGKAQPVTFPLSLVNPEIVAQEGTIEFPFDGCLSFPGVSRGGTQRHRKITLKAVSPQGQAIQIVADGIMSICLQHELDHLEGVLFIDHLNEKPDDSDLVADIQEESESSATRKKFKKLKLVDARQKSHQFL